MRLKREPPFSVASIVLKIYPALIIPAKTPQVYHSLKYSRRVVVQKNFSFKLRLIDWILVRIRLQADTQHI